MNQGQDKTPQDFSYNSFPGAPAILMYMIVETDLITSGYKSIPYHYYGSGVLTTEDYYNLECDAV
jgi:propanediol dehydratase large subunit